MVHTLAKVYSALDRSQVQENLQHLEDTFHELPEEEATPWQTSFQDNVTKIVVYVEENEKRLDKIEMDVSNLRDDFSQRIDLSSKNCTDHVNHNERWQDVIRRKELTELEDRIDERLRSLEEGQEGKESETSMKEMEGLLRGTTVQSKGENTSVMFEGPEQRRTFMKVCHGLVDQMFKEKWKDFVSQEVNAQVKNAMKTVVKGICATRAEDERREKVYENAEIRVEQLCDEIEKIYKISQDLDEEIAKLHEVEMTKVKQVAHLMSQIKALENYQLAHANDIKIVHKESNHLRDRMDSLEEKNSVNNNLANYSAIVSTNKRKTASVQFQEQMGYLRASSARRSISPINFNQR